MFAFNLEEFLAVLGQYNRTIWPMQIFAWILGILALFLSVRKTEYSSKFILSILSFFWFWNGVFFCTFYWAPIYKYAYLFSAVFVLQAFFFFASIFKSNVSFGFRKNLNSIAGLILILYAMAGYQVFGYFLGHAYPRFFSFGLVPCPTVIFTFGLLLMTDKNFPRFFILIPLIIAIAGFLPVFKGVYEDIVLILAGLIGTCLIAKRDRAKAEGK